MQILVAGTSHVRHMREHLLEVLKNTGSHEVKLLCCPGGSIQQVACRLRHCQLTAYNLILVIAGGNDLFSKAGVRLQPADSVVQQLKDLHTFLTTTTNARVAMSTILPRMPPNTPEEAARSHWPRPLYHVFDREARYINHRLSAILTKQPHLWARHLAARAQITSDCVHLTGPALRVVAANLVAHAIVHV